MSFTLENINIVEASSGVAAPMCGRLFADLGANVIWIQSTIKQNVLSPEDRRKIVGGSVIESDIDYMSQAAYRNKRCMTLNFSTEEGRTIMHRLIEKADVFLSSFRPRLIEKFKLDYETLSGINPRIITAQLTGYGSKGPDKNLPGYEGTSFYSRSGLFHVLKAGGAEPAQSPHGVGDIPTGLTLAWGIAIALYVRERTGIGQEVDTSLYQAGVFSLSLDLGGALVTGEDREPVERQEQANALMNWYQTKDGRWIRLAIANTPLYWPKVCGVLEADHLENDPRFASFDARAENHELLFNTLQEIFLTKTLAEWKPRLDEYGPPWGPIQTLPETVNDPQARANDFYVPLDHPKYGKMEVVGHPVNFGKTTESVRQPSPEWNQHTDEILLEHGFTTEDIDRFRESGAIA